MAGWAQALMPPRPHAPQREQMFAAQEMFKTANKVTRPEKALILGFMAGSRGASMLLAWWGARGPAGVGDRPLGPRHPPSPRPPQRTRARSRAT